MKRVVILATLLLLSAPAAATLFCYDYDLQEGYEWSNGKFQQAPYDPHLGWLDLSPPGIGPQIYCYANGNELAYIRQNFSGIRMRSNKTLYGNTSVYWVGDDAAFILNNI